MVFIAAISCTNEDIHKKWIWGTWKMFQVNVISFAFFFVHFVVSVKLIKKSTTQNCVNRSNKEYYYILDKSLRTLKIKN